MTEAAVVLTAWRAAGVRPGLAVRPAAHAPRGAAGGRPRPRHRVHRRGPNPEGAKGLKGHGAKADGTFLRVWAWLARASFVFGTSTPQDLPTSAIPFFVPSPLVSFRTCRGGAATRVSRHSQSTDGVVRPSEHTELYSFANNLPRRAHGGFCFLPLIKPMYLTTCQHCLPNTHNQGETRFCFEESNNCTSSRTVGVSVMPGNQTKEDPPICLSCENLVPRCFEPLSELRATVNTSVTCQPVLDGGSSWWDQTSSQMRRLSILNRKMPCTPTSK